MFSGVHELRTQICKIDHAYESHNPLTVLAKELDLTFCGGMIILTLIQTKSKSR